MGLFDRFKRKKDDGMDDRVKKTPSFKKNVKVVVETREVDETDNNEGVGIKLGMYLPPKIEKAPEDMTELDKLKNKEIDLYHKLHEEDKYWGSEISRVDFRELKAQQRDYVQRHPKDYKTRGSTIYPYIWRQIDEFSDEEQEIVEITGKGLYYEQDLEDYEKAIETYQKAYDLYWILRKEDLEKLIEEHGEGNYLWTARIVARINVCKNKIFRKKVKKLEAEAKELEEKDPKEAIKKYEELNEINPGLKKYNKRIYRMRELEAKELEKTDPIEAIKIYSELNVLNPGLKKYDKRIEIIKRKFE